MKSNNCVFLIITLFIFGLMGCKTTTEKEFKGYRFTNDWAETEVFLSNELTGSITIDMYLMLHSYPTNWTGIITKFSSESEAEFNFRFKNQNIGRWFYGNGDKMVQLGIDPNTCMPLNQWLRITCIRDFETNTMDILVNSESKGQKKFKKIKPAVATNTSIVFCAQGKRTLDATLAEVRLWSKALTPSEIAKTALEIKKPNDYSELQGYWLFDNVENGVVRDLSKHQRDVIIKKRK